MTRAMYMSKLYAPTLKEDPADAELASHRLLLRAGMIRKEAAGLYSYLPLAWRSIRKIENIVRDEMDAAGAQELMMPIMVDAELWRESGRIDAYGKELVRFDDRHGREFVLGPTHEETVTALVRNELRSYKQLPVNLYHIQDKFRDEFRPRFGLMRGREFIMKDAYSFSATQESLQEEYDKMKQAYANICERCYIKALPVVADSGEIGGDTSVEYMALADAGEASLVYCDDCGFAADDEAASTKVVVTEGPGDGALTKVETPGMGTIEAVAKFFGFPENGTRKSLALIDAEGKPVVAIVPGDHELNDCKAEHVFGKGYRMMTDEELQTYGLHKGFIGPVNLPEGIRLVCDESLRESKQWACGANEVDYHFTGACPERDFAVDEWAARKGLRLSSLKDAKNFAAGLLSAGKAGLYSDFPIEGPLPPGLVAATDGPTGLVVTTKDRMALFEVSVLVRPVILHVGIGCRRGTSASTIEDAVLSVFEEANLSLQAVADVSSIDVKGDEEGLLAFARMHSWPIRFFSADELNAVPGTFTASDFVRQTVGTDNVCERSAVRASHGGDLVVSKKAGQGITVAVACESYSLCFSNV